MNRKLAAIVALPLLAALTMTGCSFTIGPEKEMSGGAEPIGEQALTAKEIPADRHTGEPGTSPHHGQGVQRLWAA